MCEIKEFLINHPAISVRWVEQQVSIPIGSLRVRSDKPIPNKYVQPIIDILMYYGWKNTEVQTSDNTTAARVTEYIVRKDIVGYMDGFIFRRANLKDDTIVTVQHS